MSPINIDTIDAPAPIKIKIRELSSTFDISHQGRKGSNGWLFFGVNRITKQKVAIKFYDWGGDSQYHAEPSNLALINSPNVIKILDASLVDNDYAFFITPFYEKGDLDEELRRGKRGNLVAISFTRDVLNGLSHLHASSILHRDIKPQNILVSDKNEAIIGDFGSVKKLPQNTHMVPGSGHSLIYTPPESISSRQCGIQGDLYQVGITLFQLLGGYFPYEQHDWLDAKELKKYRAIIDGIDKQIFAKQCIQKMITTGKIIDINSLPPWVCVPLRKTVRKACHFDSTKRFQSCAEFLAHLQKISGSIHDWIVEEGFIIHRGVKRKYRIFTDPNNGELHVFKGINNIWRRDNSFSSRNIDGLVKEIEKK